MADTLDEEFIITEYIQAHSELRKIWNEAPGALRIVVIRERNQSPRIIYAYKIFATKKTGTTTNAVEGGVCCLVDIRTGNYSNGVTIKNNDLVL